MKTDFDFVEVVEFLGQDVLVSHAVGQDDVVLLVLVLKLLEQQGFILNMGGSTFYSWAMEVFLSFRASW